MRFLVTKINSRRAESLMEVIISVGVLMLIIAPVAGLYITSNRSADVAKKMLVAENLAQEGVELMKIVRDSNLLKFKTKETQCWLTTPNYGGDIFSCDTNGNILSTGSYVVQNTPNGVVMNSQATALSENLDAANTDAVFNLQQDENFQFVTAGGTPTPYFREVKIVLADIDNVPADNNDATGTDRATIISRVAFKSGTLVKDVIHTVTLYASK